MLLFLPDVLGMFAGVIADPRVPRVAKVQAAALVAVGISPLEAIPVLGQLQLAAMIGVALRQLVKHAGEDLLREHWAGTDAAFRVVLTLVDAGLRPRRLLWRLARGR